MQQSASVVTALEDQGRLVRWKLGRQDTSNTDTNTDTSKAVVAGGAVEGFEMWQRMDIAGRRLLQANKRHTCTVPMLPHHMFTSYASIQEAKWNERDA